MVCIPPYRIGRNRLHESLPMLSVPPDFGLYQYQLA